MSDAAQGLAVGFVTQGWTPDIGGIETHAADLARGLGALGHRVSVLCLGGRPDREAYSTSDSVVDGVPVRRLVQRYADQRAMVDMVSDPRADAAVAAWLADGRFDVLHVHHLTGFGVGALQARSGSLPVVMTLHDYWLLCPRGQMLRADGEVCARAEPHVCGECIASTWPHLARGLDAAGRSAAAAERTTRAHSALSLASLVAPSAAVAATYREADPSLPRPVIVEHGIDHAGLAAAVERERANRAPPPGDGPLHVGVLGSVQPSKGVLELARAVVRADDSRVDSRRGGARALVLDVHGPLAPYHGDASYVHALRALAAADDRVRLHGPYTRADLPRTLAGLDAVAVPSIWREAWGLSAREARAAGLPVLVSDAGGLASAAQDRRAGIVVPEGDWSAWERALVRFATDAEARARWAAEPPLVRGIAAMARDVECIYREALSGGP